MDYYPCLIYITVPSQLYASPFFFHRLHKRDVISLECAARKRNSFRSGKLNLSLLEPERNYLRFSGICAWGQSISGKK